MKPYCPQNKSRQVGENRFKKFFLAGLVLLIIFSAGVAVFLYKAPFFKIKNLEISGGQSYSSAELADSLKKFLAGESAVASLLGTENIFSWNLEPREFLEKYPQYEEITVDKDFFSRQIKVEVREREKFGLWCLEKINQPAESIEILENSGEATSTVAVETAAQKLFKNCWWFDKAGVAFAEAPKVEGELFNRVKDKTSRELKLGAEVLRQDYFANILKIFKIMEAADLKSKTIQLDSIELAEASVEYVTSPKIYFSLESNPEFSLAAIKELKKNGKWPKLTYVDFRVENRAYYK